MFHFWTKLIGDLCVLDENHYWTKEQRSTGDAATNNRKIAGSTVNGWFVRVF